ncbi:hypothetical protein [Streptomyces paradoxus]|uniref:hypothetical protein n=1 Tax=Streptomyces paradoxus TaxID=66375 RepID=UPI00382D2CEF
MRPRRLRSRLASLLALLLALTGLSGVPALADDPAELHGLKGESCSAPGSFDFHTLKATTTAHDALIRDASRVTPTGCPAARPVLD